MKAKSSGVHICDGKFYSDFHDLLSASLRCHGVVPTHSLEEIERLCHLFPKNLILKGAFYEEELIAASLLFNFENVIHTQYLASGNTGRKLAALDLLIDSSLEEYSGEKRFFSFGISTTGNGHDLNEGLVFFKESFGARALLVDQYELAI